MKLTCGVDWAEAHHDIALIDEGGAVIARSRIDTGADGFNELLSLIGEHGGTIEDTPVAIETDKNLLVVALVEAGFTLYPINPRAVARYLERHSQSGGKSDPRKDFHSDVTEAGYELVRSVPVYGEEEMRQLIGVDDRYLLFKRRS